MTAPGGVRSALDGPAIARWCLTSRDALAAHRPEIDELNVFPVPDRDTGTNLLVTIGAAAERVRDLAEPRADLVLTAMADAATMAAAGNSGVIVGQLLRGLARSLAGTHVVDGPALARALAAGADAAWASIGEPVEGTALTVLRRVERRANQVADAGADLAGVVRAAALVAAEALRHTPDQLPALGNRVDAGGRGVVLLFDALASVVTGAPPPTRSAAVPVAPPDPVPESAGYSYEVRYHLATDPDLADGPIRELRRVLAGLGDSVAVAEIGAGRWTVHAHVDDVGAAIEAGIEVGRPSQIGVVRFADQLAGPAVGLVAVAPGDGLTELFEAEGVVVADSTVEAVLAAIDGTGATAVAVLPNRADRATVADRAARIARSRGRNVAVVPTRSPVQGLAAVAVHDPSRRFADDVIAMAEAAAATRWAEVTVADGDALTSAGRCRAGDVLGMAEDDVVLIGRSVPDVVRDLLDRLLFTGGELVTVLLGGSAEPGLRGSIERHLAVRHPAVEVTVHDHGPVDRPVLLGVE